MGIKFEKVVRRLRRAPIADTPSAPPPPSGHNAESRETETAVLEGRLYSGAGNDKAGPGGVDESVPAQSVENAPLTVSAPAKVESQRGIPFDVETQELALKDYERAYLVGLRRLEEMGLDTDLRREAATDLAKKFVRRYGDGALNTLERKLRAGQWSG